MSTISNNENKLSPFQQKKIIQQLYQNEPKIDLEQKYLLISAEWLNIWKKYVKFDESEQESQTENNNNIDNIKTQQTRATSTAYANSAEVESWLKCIDIWCSPKKTNIELIIEDQNWILQTTKKISALRNQQQTYYEIVIKKKKKHYAIAQSINPDSIMIAWELIKAAMPQFKQRQFDNQPKEAIKFFGILFSVRTSFKSLQEALDSEKLKKQQTEHVASVLGGVGF
eukprot:TRINITY_DN2246_c0_g4_i1.p1 TRINITY_DN2246_c0_g4~~TRINITY_DN2246_c0_g4_i1.p1  ORF type:complete len:227 (-),score=112.11 TRINITY_DN2246_c0_g4_i1:29-709(-)